MDTRKSAIFAFQFVKPILKTIVLLILYTVLEIWFWSVKCTSVTVRYAKMPSILISILSHQYQAMQANATVRLYENKLLQNAFKCIWHYIYLFKLYSTSIILLPKNNLTNIWSKIGKTGINLWRVYTWNMKSSGKYERREEGECTLHRWSRSWEICGCTSPF